MLINSNNIYRLLPHRHPFLYVDSVQTYIPNKEILAQKSITLSDPVFQGHFPEKPIYPGVLIVESLAQTCSIMNVLENIQWDGKSQLPDKITFDGIGVLGSIKVTLQKPVFPNCTLNLKCEKVRQADRNIFFSVEASCLEGVVASGSLIVGIVDNNFFEVNNK